METLVIIGAIAGITVFIALVVIGLKAANRSAEIFEEYRGVFGRYTASILMLTVIGVIGVIALAIMQFFGDNGDSFGKEMLLANTIWVIFFGVILTLLVLRAKSRCPEELRQDLWKNLIIAAIGAFGGYCRLSWNIIFTVMSIFPGLGWTANFIISKDKEYKKKMVDMGKQNDEDTQERWKREREEEMAKEQSLQRQKQEREERTRKEIWERTGRSDIVFNSDSSLWKFSDESSYDHKAKDI